jgi:cardiolipin synthase
LEGCGNPSDRRMCLEFYKHVLGTVGLYFENRKRLYILSCNLHGKTQAAGKIHADEKGFVQPYTDSPLDHEDVGENVYLNMISRAKKYLYIFTPYLIIGSEMRTALVNAAKSGVDVRLVVPGIPDKKLVYFLTQSNFPYLIKNGVKIYTYTPGFIHAKCFVSDDVQATVGTVNMDYRSLCLHFECGVWMYRTRAVLQVKEDALKTFAESHEVTLEEFQKKSFLVRTFMGALKLFAPLL